MRWLFSAIVLAGCASARVEGGGNNDIDANQNNGGDANNNQDANADAPLIDAPPPPPDAPPPPPPMAVTMQQTGATNVVATQIGCQQTNPATGFTRENSYYRIYPLSDFNITKPFSISKVNFSVERATAGNGVSQPAQIKLGTYSGTLNASTFALASLQQLASATIQIPQNATSVEVPIASFTPNTLTVQPSALLYVEIFIPDGAAAGNTFYLGSNGGSETHPSYIRAPLCNVASPATYATILTSPLIRTLITVSGSF